MSKRGKSWYCDWCNAIASKANGNLQVVVDEFDPKYGRRSFCFDCFDEYEALKASEAHTLHPLSKKESES